MGLEKEKDQQQSVARRIFRTYLYVTTWIVLSGTAIMYNKVGGFCLLRKLFLAVVPAQAGAFRM
jgi:hypothetical protein